MQPALVIMASGIGRRYGGLKQIDPMGPCGEIIIDYSLYDALRAGFEKLVFVICHDIEEDFKEVVGRRMEKRADVRYAFQELDQLPEGFSLPPTRTKPWGTAHAVMAAEEHVEEPFAVINADDFYGQDVFRVLAEFLKQPQQGDMPEFAMVGFTLRNTLSEYGSVARGVCEATPDGYLQHVVERTKIETDGDKARFIDDDGTVVPLTGDEIVSMNTWGFTPALFGHLRSQFRAYLEKRIGEDKAEFFLPGVVDRLIAAGEARVKVLPTTSRWFGVTYKEDKATAQKCIRELIDAGVYPENLWGE